MCSKQLNDKECKVLGDSQNLEESYREETILFLIHIAKYIQKKRSEVKENDSLLSKVWQIF